MIHTSLIMYILIQNIENKVQEKNFGEIQDLNHEEVVVTKNCISTLLQHETYYTVPRHGDILVGFYLEEAETQIEMQITIGGKRLNNITLSPGNCTYFLNGTHMFPIISLCYSEIHIIVERNGIESTDFKGISCIYALLQSDARRSLANSCVVFDDARGLLSNGNYYEFENIIERYKYTQNKDVIGLPSMVLNKPPMANLQYKKKGITGLNS